MNLRLVSAKLLDSEDNKLLKKKDANADPQSEDEISPEKILTFYLARTLHKFKVYVNQSKKGKMSDLDDLLICGASKLLETLSPEVSLAKVYTVCLSSFMLSPFYPNS